MTKTTPVEVKVAFYEMLIGFPLRIKKLDRRHSASGTLQDIFGNLPGVEAILVP